MKRFFKLLFIFFTLTFAKNTYATFSIIAVDTKTKEFGAALATCIYDIKNPNKDFTGMVKNVWNSHVITYVPGIGIMNMLGEVDNMNLVIKKLVTHKMSRGWMADAIINDLTININAEHINRSINKKQFLALTLDSSSFQVFKKYHNGLELDSYSDAVQGQTDDGRYHFVIAGNILTDKNILTSLESGFKNTPGILNKKLIGALKNVRKKSGMGDRRCINIKNISSNASFLRIYKDDKIDTDLFSYTLISNGQDAIDKIVQENSLKKKS